MNEITLAPQGRLVHTHWTYDEAQAQGCYVDTDVSSRAAEFLTEPTTLAEGVTLRDVFTLLHRNPILLTVFRRNFAVELLAEALCTTAPGISAVAAHERIEYLELRSSWYKNSDTREVHSMTRPGLHGMGPVLTEDVFDNGNLVHPAGARIAWGVSLAPVSELLDLPLRVAQDVRVFEDDANARQYGEILEEIAFKELTLIQVVQGVLWELSFHGAGPSRDAAQP